MNTAKDVFEHPQYAARQYFVEVDHPVAGKYRYPGWPYKMSVSPPQVSRPAPLLGQHNDEILKEILPNIKSKESGNLSNVSLEQSYPLKGIRVLDFSWVWAGPYACMLLASLGAEVIKIEGHKRTDILRRTYPWPLPEPAPIKCPLNQGMSYNQVNMNKKSLTLDLSKDEGKALARRLASISDIVLDNMRPGAMEKLGLGYIALRTSDRILSSLPPPARDWADPIPIIWGLPRFITALEGEPILPVIRMIIPATALPGM